MLELLLNRTVSHCEQTVPTVKLSQLWVQQWPLTRKRNCQQKIFPSNSTQYINDSEKEKEEQNEELRERVDEKLKDMEEMPALRKIGIKFVKHKDPECNVVNVVDTESEEMIRQIPSEEFLKISQKLDEFCDDFTKVKQTNAEDDAKGRGKNHSVLFDTKI